MKITLDVSEDNECTSEPWWAILDPSFYASNNVDYLAGCIEGPFFSREEAQAELDATRYNYSKRACVYCMSGYHTRQYKAACREARRPWYDRPILRDLFWFKYLPYKFGEWLRGRKQYD